MDRMKTGTLIKKARIKKNYTQSELGNLIGVSNKAVSRWENGESFPDVGLLEKLSTILDLRIQDIITGTQEGSDESALIEVVRTVQLQNGAKKRGIISCVLQIALIGFCVISGVSAMGYNSFLSVYSYVALMIISFVLTILICLIKKDTRRNEFNIGDKCFVVISIFAFLCSIIVTGGVIMMISSGYVPFGIEVSLIGPIINIVLIVLFLIEVLLITLHLFRYFRVSYLMQLEYNISVATIYLISLYGDWLHKMNSFQEGVKDFAIITSAVSIALAILIIILRILNNKEITIV